MKEHIKSLEGMVESLKSQIPRIEGEKADSWTDGEDEESGTDGEEPRVMIKVKLSRCLICNVKFTDHV